MESNLKDGDTVKLNSGGPTMTVVKIDGDDIDCRWFDGQELKVATFKATHLRHFKPGPKMA